MKKYFWLLCIVLLLVIIISAGSIDNSDILSYRISGAIITVLIVLILWMVIFVMLFKSEKKSKPIKVNVAYLYKNLSLDILSKYNIDFSEFKKMVYKKFKDIHIALSSYDLDLLKLNLTKDLYNEYVLELEELDRKKEKNIMKDFELINFKIYNVLDEYELLQIDVYINVRMLDYTINLDTDRIIKGSDTDKVELEYEITFIKNDNSKDLYNNFVMCKKRCINEMNVEKINSVDKHIKRGK